MQHSIRVRILFPLITYTHIHVTTSSEIRDYFRSFGKECRKIRRAEFFETVVYKTHKFKNIILSCIRKSHPKCLNRYAQLILTSSRDTKTLNIDKQDS
jgi:hypothetical protein